MSAECEFQQPESLETKLRMFLFLQPTKGTAQD